MTILITGATGFVGEKVLNKILVEYPNDEIVVLSDKTVDNKSVRVIPSLHYRFDSDYFTSKGINADVVIHIGAYTPKSGNEANRIHECTGNITSTESLLDAVSGFNRLKEFIYISTLDVYAETNDVISERTATIPQTMYGWSKLYCEQMVTNHCKQNEIQSVILRLGHVYGEGEEKYRKVMPIMIQNAILKKDITIYGDGEALRTFIYIDDVAQAIVNAIGIETSEVINVVGNRAISINSLAELIVGITESFVPIVHIPTVAPNKNLIFDNQKLMRLLLNRLVPLEEGLRREVLYIREKNTGNL